MTIELKAGADDAGRRLDRILRKALPDCSLSLVHRLLRQGKIRLDGEPAGPEARVRAGALIQIRARPESLSRQPARESGAALPPLPEVLARGSGIVVFNKPAGLASQGPGSLDAIVKAGHAQKPPASLSFRPGPLHRLDRPTSGAIAFSESLAGARLFAELLREQKVAKTYLAIVEGQTPFDSEFWADDLSRDERAKKTFVAHSGLAGEPRISAKEARAWVRALACGGGYSLIEARIVTGRTHQIRAQAASRGHPLAGDVKYGGRAIPGGGFFLHSWEIGFDREIAGLPMAIRAPLPKRFLAIARELFGKNLPEILP